MKKVTESAAAAIVGGYSSCSAWTKNTDSSKMAKESRNCSESGKHGTSYTTEYR